MKFEPRLAWLDTHRVRCILQNLVDSLGQRFQGPGPEERHGELNTFVVFNRRRKVTSSAKRRRVPGSLHLAQTPDGSFLDLQTNAADLLRRCGFLQVPEVGHCWVCTCVLEPAGCVLLASCNSWRFAWVSCMAA